MLAESVQHGLVERRHYIILVTDAVRLLLEELDEAEKLAMEQQAQAEALEEASRRLSASSAHQCAFPCHQFEFPSRQLEVA